jgi:glycosyltransferase involved in cell wall biosynthesis
VITRHVIEEPSRSWREAARALAALWAARRADALVAVSSAAATSWAALARVPEARVRVIPNGIEVERFDRADLAARRGALRAGLGLTERDDAILVLAVLREGKGHEVLLRALTTLRGSRPTARLLVAGAGEREAELRRLASPLGDAVAFLGHREDTPELLAAADVVALPSFAEALPTALVEAAAAGKPAVATRVGGTPDVVVDGVTGWLVPPRDADALARALGQALADPARAAAMGEAARARARERFTLDAQVDATLRLWQEVAAQRPH